MIFLQLSIVVWSYFYRNGENFLILRLFLSSFLTSNSIFLSPSFLQTVMIIEVIFCLLLWTGLSNIFFSCICSWIFLFFLFSVNSSDTALKQWQRTQESLNSMGNQHATTIASHVRFVNFSREHSFIQWIQKHLLMNCIWSDRYN